MSHDGYMMESEDEVIRLDIKTNGRVVEKNASWAGLKQGMRVADIGCGSGKTTFHLNKLIQPGGKALGLDLAKQRIDYAAGHYGEKGIDFICRDVREPLDDLGQFDFVWVRFLLEYYSSSSFDIIKHISGILKPGGILCLIDLDYNCLVQYGFSKRLGDNINSIMSAVEKKYDFDPYVGKKLYSFLYDMGYQNIQANIQPHNLIYDKISSEAAFNWTKKIEVAVKQSGYEFKDYPGGFNEFFDEFQNDIHNPRRFSYSVKVTCRGVKPSP